MANSRQWLKDGKGADFAVNQFLQSHWLSVIKVRYYLNIAELRRIR